MKIEDCNLNRKVILLDIDKGIWVWECQDGSFFYDKACMEMFGYAQHQVPFHISAWNQLLHPEDKERVLVKQQKILEGSSLSDTFTDQFRLLNAMGNYTWIEERGVVLCRDQTGKAIRICGVYIDMNKLNKIENEVDLQHDRMLFALEAANDGLWDWNPQTNQVYFSPRYISMLGYRPSKFPPVLDSWVSRVHPDDFKKTVDMQLEYIESSAHGDVFDCIYRFKGADGHYKWILGRGKVTKRDAQGRGTRVVGLHTDVTELHNMQDALRQMLNRDHLTNLYSRFYFDSSVREIDVEDYPISIVYYDVDGLKMVNDTLGHTCGDEMLIQASAFILQSIPAQGIAARLGGDEFVVLLRHTTRQEAEKIAYSIQENMERYNRKPHVLPIFMSMGIVTSESNTPIHTLLSYADVEMAKNKQVQRQKRRNILMQHLEKVIGKKIRFVDTRLFES